METVCWLGEASHDFLKGPGIIPGIRVDSPILRADPYTLQPQLKRESWDKAPSASALLPVALGPHTAPGSGPAAHIGSPEGKAPLDLGTPSRGDGGPDTPCSHSPDGHLQQDRDILGSMPFQ